MKDYKLIDATQAEATTWYGSFTIEVNGKRYDIGMEVSEFGNTLYADELDKDNVDLDYNELEEIAEIAIMQGLDHAEEAKEEMEQERLEEKAGL